MKTAPTILLVEQDEPVRVSLGQLLIRSGFEVLLTSSGEDAISILSIQIPDLVISDIVMGGMSGLDLAAEIDTMKSPPPVILMTGGDVEKYSGQVIPTCVRMILQKPFTTEKLLNSIEKVLGA